MRMRRPVLPWLVALAIAVPAGQPGPGPGPGWLAAQESGSPVTLGGLLRTGARLEPGDALRRDGFEVFDARLSLEGKIGIAFEYFLQGAFEAPDDGSAEGDGSGLEFALLDARLTLPFRPELRLSLGQFKAPLGGERLLSKGEIRFLQRSLADRAIAPGRQVGVALGGETMEGRLTYEAGAFNGNGRGLGNDDESFLYAARVQYNTVGPIEFYEDVVLQVGLNLGFSRDSAAPLGPGLDGSLPGDPGLPPGVDLASWRGDRFLFGFDLHTSYRGWQLNGEYLRIDLDPAVPEADDLAAWGGYVEGVYGLHGVAEVALRYDHLDPVAGPDRRFLIGGLHVFPGFHAKLGLQYAVAVGGSADAPGIAGGQFILLTQASF